MDNFVVTGHRGFIGSHMVKFLEKKGHHVEAGILNISKGVDGVFHFAANMGGVGFFNKHNYQPFIDNTLLDLEVFQSCTNIGARLFYPASACAYPVNIQATEGQTPQLREDMLIPANADQMYGWEKLMMILLAKEAPFDVRVGILNTVFGEGQEWEGERAKFPPAITHKVLESKRTGKPIQIWGNGKQTRTFLYIEDALEKMYEVMIAPEYHGEVNIASDEIVTVQQVADWLCEYAGIKPNYEYDLTKPSGVLARGIDNSKFNWHYKYRDKFTTRQGFERLYDWMAKQ